MVTTASAVLVIAILQQSAAESSVSSSSGELLAPLAAPKVLNACLWSAAPPLSCRLPAAALATQRMASLPLDGGETPLPANEERQTAERQAWRAFQMAHWVFTALGGAAYAPAATTSPMSQFGFARSVASKDLPAYVERLSRLYQHCLRFRRLFVRHRPVAVSKWPSTDWQTGSVWRTTGRNRRQRRWQQQEETDGMGVVWVKK